MVSYRYLILLIGLSLVACAQVGTISGGEKDITAPKPVSEKIKPPNESIMFTAKEVEIPFSEFFRLVDPVQNIKMVPPHAKIKAEVKKKSLYLSWEEDLKPNTTYAIYLKNAIADYTEGNDTIIQYVFSTGENLDTLSFSVRVVDAWSGEPASCLVGIFDVETNELKSFAETNGKGEAQLNYLHSGQYSVLAFNDQNSDLAAQEHEAKGFPVVPTIQLDSVLVDTIPIRMFTPPAKPKVSSSRFLAPGSFLIGATREISNETIFLNGAKLNESDYLFLDRDSLQLFADVTELNLAEIILNSDLVNDTLKIRFTDKNKNVPVTISGSNATNRFAPSEPIEFSVNDLILEADTSKIKIENTIDSTVIYKYTFDFKHNRITISLDKTELLNLAFTFSEGAIKTSNGNSKEFISTIQLDPERKFGSLKIDLSYYTTPVLLNVLHNGKFLKEIRIPAPRKDFLIAELVPGNYTFKVVRDENDNGQWDVGDLKKLIQPETVDNYSTPTTVRANWEVELSLIPKN